MIKVKDASQSAQKWGTNTAGATADYQQGVLNPKTDWKTATLAGSENWKLGVSKAATSGAFNRGVAKAGSEKQQQNAATKGVSRFAEGVAVAKSEYETAMIPVLNTIQSVNLPPRGPKGDPRNLARVGAVSTALSTAKRGAFK